MKMHPVFRLVGVDNPMQFKCFVEGKDSFGFEEIEAKKDKDADNLPPDEEEKPIRPFNVQWMMDVLARQKIDGRIRTSKAFLDEVAWGDKPGATRVRLTPNITIYIERLTDDLLGAKTWVLKKVFKPKLKEYAGHEEVVAHEVFEEVEKFHFQPIESATENFNDLLHLTKRMTDRVRSHAPLIYDYQDTKVVNEDYYIIYFSIRNAGVGKLATHARKVTQSPEATIDVNFNKERGLIHVILSTVTAGGEGQGWGIDIPVLDSFFAPTQNKDEIIDTVIASLKFY